MKRSNSLLLIGVVVLVLGYLAYAQLQEGFSDVSGACPRGEVKKGCTTLTGVKTYGGCVSCPATYTLTNDKGMCTKSSTKPVAVITKPFDLCIPGGA